MVIKRRYVACTAVMAALAVPVTSAGAATGSPRPSNPTCPADYHGPTNPATGCPWYLMTDTGATQTGATDAGGAPSGVLGLLGPQLAPAFGSIPSFMAFAPAGFTR
jgi:hypothetical protein